MISNDNSPDGTTAIVQRLIDTRTAEGTAFSQTLHLVTRSGKNGLGTAYIEGFRFCLEKGYDYIFEMDADFSHEEIMLALDELVRSGKVRILGCSNETTWGLMKSQWAADVHGTAMATLRFAYAEVLSLDQWRRSQ